MLYELISKVVLKENVEVGITVTLELSTEDKNHCNLFYHHIMTNQKCETLSQVFSGWSEQDKEAQEDWNELERRLIKNDNLCEFLAEDYTDDVVILKDLIHIDSYGFLS